jgi:hypothetical protein
LELKEIEISRVTSQIVELKTTFEKEETLRYEYAIMFHIFFASTTTIVFTFRLEMETQISEYGLKLENLENGKRHFIIYSIFKMTK